MKKIIFGLLALYSVSAFAETYRWECSTHNFLAGNQDNQNKMNVVYDLESGGPEKKIVLSENSASKISLIQIGEAIEIEAVDAVTKKKLGVARGGIESRTLTLWPAEPSTPAFVHVSCFNLDYDKSKIDGSSRDDRKETEGSSQGERSSSSASNQ